MTRYLIETVKVTVNQKYLRNFVILQRIIIPYLAYKYYGVFLGAQIYQVRSNSNVFVIYLIYRNNRYINKYVNLISCEMTCLTKKFLKENVVFESLFNIFNTKRIL